MVEVGDIVSFISDEGKIGRVEEIIPFLIDGPSIGLPGARVVWAGGAHEILALGYLVPLKGNE